MKYSQILFCAAFAFLLENVVCSEEQSTSSPDFTCNKRHCQQCQDAETVCQRLETCTTGNDGSPFCKRIRKVQEEMIDFCDSCEISKKRCQSPARCAGRNQMFPFFPMGCGKAGVTCDKNYKCCKGLNCKQTGSGKEKGKCCAAENQSCSKAGDKSCCEPYSCEKNPSGKGHVCSATLPILPAKTSTTPTPIVLTSTTTTTPAPTTPSLPSQVTSEDCAQTVVTEASTSDNFTSEDSASPSIPSTTPSQSGYTDEGLCKAPGNFNPAFPPPPEPNCYNCSYNDPVCCDGQYCDIKEGLCMSCSSGLQDECRSKPQKESDCCTASLACKISKRGDETGICEASCASDGRNVCDSDYNCCREDSKSRPTRFECRYVNATGGETYYCRKCAKPGECCRTSRDCCKSPIGYACFNQRCDYSREETNENSTVDTETG